MYTKHHLTPLLTVLIGLHGMAQPHESLVPSIPSTAPDYYCTWNLQGYVCSYSFGAGSNDLRAEMNQDNIFGGSAVYPTTTMSVCDNGTGQFSVPVQPLYKGWINHYPMLHADLDFIMDDSWDIPKESNSKRPGGTNYDNPFLARAALDESRFPAFQGSDTERLAALVDSAKSYGWRGIGGWICAQDPIFLTKEYTGLENTLSNSKKWTEAQEETYWKLRLSQAEQAGFAYWKLDWGNKDRDDTFRRNISKWAREVAPHVVLENASFQDGGTHKPEYIHFSQTLRTYDVNNNIAQAQTISRVLEVLSKGVSTCPDGGIINCEDEPYIAAGLGCAIGVMRHPYVGALPNGNADTYFEGGTRRIKNRLMETVRGVRWHRIAGPIASASDYRASTTLLSETGNGKSASAPAVASRRMPLPKFTGAAATHEKRPYLLASVYDNECCAIAIINRNIDGTYQKQRFNVSAEPLRWDRKVGVFGYVRSLTLKYQNGLPTSSFRVLAQDLACDGAPTELPFTINAGRTAISINGSDIEALCAGHDYPYDEVTREPGKDYTDCSDPAIVLLVVSDDSEETPDGISEALAPSANSDAFRLDGTPTPGYAHGLLVRNRQKYLYR